MMGLLMAIGAASLSLDGGAPEQCGTVAADGVGCGHALFYNSISDRCGIAVFKASSALSQERGLNVVAFVKKYSNVRCVDHGDTVAVFLKRGAGDRTLVLDGEDYFLFDTERWNTLERWDEGGAWIDPGSASDAVRSSRWVFHLPQAPRTVAKDGGDAQVEPLSKVEDVPGWCAAAAATVFGLREAMRDAGGSSHLGLEYESAMCFGSRVEPGRTYVLLNPAESWRYRDAGLIYVVESSGQIYPRRSLPCEEHPSACE